MSASRPSRRRRSDDRGQIVLRRPLDLPTPSVLALGELINMHRKDRTKDAQSRVRAPRAAHKAHPSSVVRPPSSEWWSQTGSNRRPHACKARALPTELWPRRRTEDRERRTDNPSSVVRCPSSDVRRPIMVGLGGLEPPTSRLSSARSNQLSYKPLPEDGGRRTDDRKAHSVLCRRFSVVRKERETKAARSRKTRPDWPLNFRTDVKTCRLQQPKGPAFRSPSSVF